MTREEFIEILKNKRYSYKIEGDTLVVYHQGAVELPKIESIPSDVIFRNGGHVNLNFLKNLPSNVQFLNSGGVYMQSLKSLPAGAVFKNDGMVNLPLLINISPGTVFGNKGIVDLADSRLSIPPGVEFQNEDYVWIGRFKVHTGKLWSAKVEGIKNNRLLNLMIKSGLFL